MALVDSETGADLYDVTQEVLSDAGFEAYEVSNHARGIAARSRHNPRLLARRGLRRRRPRALTPPDAERPSPRRSAHRRVSDYIAAVEAHGLGFDDFAPLDPREQALERLLMGLRTVEGAALDELAPIPLNAARSRIYPSTN
jgi:oxygen-independent coproporphyrinogen-3 oxidase